MTRRPGRPSAGDARNDALRAIVRAIIAADHNGVQRPAAAAFGVTPATLNDFLNGRSGAGQHLCDGLVAYLRRPIEEIVAAGGDLAELRKARRGAPSVEVIFGELPLWADLLAGAQALAPEIPAWCWRDVAEAVVWVRGPITSSMVVDLAKFFLRHAPPHA
jgi:hypothetical protein